MITITTFLFENNENINDLKIVKIDLATDSIPKEYYSFMDEVFKQMDSSDKKYNSTLYSFNQENEDNDEPMSDNLVKKFWKPRKLILFFLLKNEKPIGFADIYPYNIYYKDSITIKQFCILKKYRGLGYGSFLMNAIQTEFKNKHHVLNVNAFNKTGISLYTKFNFKPVTYTMMKF